MVPADHIWWGGWWWMFPMALPFVFFLLLILFFYFLFTCWWSRTRWSNTSLRRDLETPLDILKKRYARGEITKEEFDRMKKDILD